MKYKIIPKENYTIYENDNGIRIGTGSVPVLFQDGYAFKDLALTGELLPYEDWRLSYLERSRDLASRMRIEELAGLMLFSPHQMIPSLQREPFASHYNGKPFEESGAERFALTDEQKKLLEHDHIRHFLVMKLESTKTAIRWNNELQLYAEKLPFGIPVSNSSDPRHGCQAGGAEFKSSAADVSRWPEGLGMAALFSKEACLEYAKIISREYRALGITSSLSPQIDLATEPRWMRLEDTYGVHPQLVADYAKAYCDGMQTTQGSENGWGKESICTMAKHWPGGGTGEGGRDAHYPFGKYAVYPGGQFETHLYPFLSGAFSLDGPTGKAASVMPYYTISYGTDQKYGTKAGNSYNTFLIQDLLREKYGYEGVICTDWGITQDPAECIDSFGSRCFGVENLSEAERHLLAIENGIDQFGGNSELEPVLKAYELGVIKYGEKKMRERLECSAIRILINLFRLGLFENPYVDLESGIQTVGCKSHCEAGFSAQLSSVVMVKNDGVLPVSGKKKVYLPKRFVRARKTFFRTEGKDSIIDPVTSEELIPYYERSSSPEEADFAIVMIESPLSDGYSEKDASEGGNGYLPITLQYRPYTADTARKISIAGGDFRESTDNRSYHGKSNRPANEQDLDLVIETKKAMGDKPVIVCIHMHNPTVLKELEPYADCILVEFGVQKKALLDLISGEAEPSGLLPIVLPASMEEVEKHCEDVAFDILPYTDTLGNTYDFGFGLNFTGRIQDERTKRYKKGK